MKAEFNINCPLSLDEANEIQNMFSLYDIELYCGIDQYVITNIGIRKFKYGKTNDVTIRCYMLGQAISEALDEVETEEEE